MTQFYSFASLASEDGFIGIKDNTQIPEKNPEFKTCKQYMYQTREGTYLKDCWIEINGVLNHFDADGFLQFGWFNDNGEWYLLPSTIGAAIGEDKSYLNQPNLDPITGHLLHLKKVDPMFIQEKLSYLRVKFPDSAYWNHMGYDEQSLLDYANITTTLPCTHGRTYNRTTSKCNQYRNGLQCAGFAYKLSDEIFGEEAPYLQTYNYHYNSIKVGDILRYDEHSVFVIHKENDFIQVVEVNYGFTCMIKWDRTITKDALELKSPRITSRY